MQDDVSYFKDLLIKLFEDGKTNMGKNQAIEQINTAYNTFKIMTQH